jgi:hypothetical protein
MRATIYSLGGFGTTRKEVEIHEITLIDWAQYKQVPAVTYTEKRKRTKMQMRADSTTPTWLIVDGWNHPDAPNGFSDDLGTTGITIKRSIGAMYGDEYKVQFEAFRDQLIKTCKVIFDGKVSTL